jgi:hypothetical protein
VSSHCNIQPSRLQLCASKFSLAPSQKCYLKHRRLIEDKLSVSAAIRLLVWALVPMQTLIGLRQTPRQFSQVENMALVLAAMLTSFEIATLLLMTHEQAEANSLSDKWKVRQQRCEMLSR